MSLKLTDLYRNRMLDLLRRATRALEQLTDEQINWRPNTESNSIANLVIHLEGNLQHFVESRLGGAESRRNRDLEFNSREHLTAAQAAGRLSAAVERAGTVIAALPAERLEEQVAWIGDSQVLVAELLLTLTVHLGEHVGQMLYIAKALRGEEFQVVSYSHKKA